MFHQKRTMFDLWCLVAVMAMMGGELLPRAYSTPEPTEPPTVSAEPTTSPMPTISKSPTMQPSLSPSPSTQPSISMEPTVSAQPSFSPSDSMSPTEMPSAFPTKACYDNSTHIVEALSRGSDNYRQEIILCPNTVFNIGVPDYSNRGKCCINGDHFLMVKSKTTLKCGEDGDPANNCIIRGGDNQLIVGPGGFFSFRVVDVLIQGLTFESPRLTSLLTTSEGDITFEDCVFRHIKASSPVISIHTPIPFFNLPGEDKMVIAFRRTVFEYIEQTYGQGGIEIEGIMAMITFWNSVLLEDCIFRHNHFPGTPQSPSGYAIKVTGASLEIRNTCFYNNTFTGWGPIQAFNGSQVTQVNNYAEDDSGDVTCNFVAASTNFIPNERSDISCSNPTADFCINADMSDIDDDNGNNTTLGTEGLDDKGSASVSFRQGGVVLRTLWLLAPLSLSVAFGFM